MKKTTAAAPVVPTEEPEDNVPDSVGRSKLKKAVTLILAVLACVALFITIFFTCIQSVAFDEHRYAAGQEKLGLADAAGISQADMNTVMHELLLYCRGDRSNLDMQAQINGQMREVFDEREKEHMVDVQKLFVKGFKLRTVMIIAFFFLLLVLIYAARKRTLRELARGWVLTVSVLGALLVIIGIYFAVDFDNAWTQFHLIFFSNDLWQLYNDEMLIQMLLPLFDGIVQAVMITSALALAIVTALAVFVLRITRRQKLEADGV
jgi:integral membrane protein (TIGR01906 family)